MTGAPSIGELLDACADRYRHRPALIWGAGTGRREMSFGELGAAGARLAGGLRARGVATGDAVLVLEPMSPRLYQVLIALFRLGAVALFPDPQSLRPTISAACRQFRPAAMIGAPRAHALRLVMPELRRIPLHLSTGRALPFTPSVRGLDKHPPLDAAAGADPDAPALITFTSGSTGVPKAVPRSHRLLLSQHTALRAHMPLEGDSPCLVALPVLVLSNLLEGVPSLLPAADVRRPGAVDPAPLLAQIAENRAGSLIASPALVERLVQAAGSDGAALFGISRIFTGGGPVFPDLMAAVRRTLPRATLHIAYGSSEAEPIAHMLPEELTPADRQLMAHGGGLPAGRPVPPVRVAILRTELIGDTRMAAADFDRLRCAPGERGEICVTGPHVVKSYCDPAHNVETKLEVAGEVWHRTGDAGRLDGEGRLWLCGRWSARMLHNGEWLYPFEVEAVARLVLPGRPVACADIGGTPVLAVQGRLTPRARRVLERALHPLGVTRVASLPRLPLDRRHNSKIDYPALRRLLGDGGAGQVRRASPMHFLRRRASRLQRPGSAKTG